MTPAPFPYLLAGGDPAYVSPLVDEVAPPRGGRPVRSPTGWPTCRDCGRAIRVGSGGRYIHVTKRARETCVAMPDGAQSWA